MPKHVIDAKNVPLGRVATRAAVLLQGKDSAAYERRKEGENEVVIKNAHLVKVTGRKADEKMYYRHSGKPGSLKKISYKDAFQKNPEWVIRHAVSGMLPKNRLQKERLKKLQFENRG